MKPSQRYLHFRPSYESPLVAGLSYFDISNADLCRWSLENFQLIDCFPKISQAYYLKLRLLAPDLLLIVENDLLKLFDLNSGSVIQKLQVEQFIEEIETEPSLGIVLFSIASSKKNSKDIVKWKLVDRKLELVGKVTVQFADQEIYDSLFMLRVFPSGRVFFYRRDTNKIFEIQVEENQVKANTIPTTTTALLELSNKKDFAVASLGKIDINDPSKGTFCGYIDCKEEIYNTIIQLGEEEVLISASNKGVKMWPMKESKGQPKVFAKSDRLVIDQLSINGKQLIGLAEKNKTIAVWDLQTCELVRMEKLSRQELQKSIRLNQKHLCLIIRIFDETEETLSFHHKLQILDVNTDTVVMSKEIKKAGFNVNVESLLRVDDETIRFICFSDSVEKPKEYLFTWKPFVKEQKKDMTKIDLIKTPITKLYAFDRILFANPPKDKVAVYSAFGKTEHRTQVSVNSHNMKKIGDVILEGYCDNFELAPNDKLYVVREDKTEVYSLQAGKFAKLLEVKLCLTSLHSIGKNLLAINTSGDRILYDDKFELLMKAQEETKEPIAQIIPLDSNRFLILYRDQRLELWDVSKQEIQSKKLDLEIIDIATTTENRLFVTQLNRIEMLDVYSVIG